MQLNVEKMPRENVLQPNNIYMGDCLSLMKGVEDKSIDMILCDLPYGTTACSWDVVIPFEPLWKHYKRIIKENGAIVLFGSEPFSSYLRMSNIKWYKYDWIWNKAGGGNFQIVRYKPMCSHENISVFCKKALKYTPQMRDRNKPRFSKNNGTTRIANVSNGKKYIATSILEKKYPITSLYFSNQDNARKYHPTQKPLELCKYLIRTYTNKGDLVLDNTMGSGTTCVAAIQEKRKFIGIEKEKEYFDIAKQRIEKCQQTLF